MNDFRFDDPDFYVNGTPHKAFAQLRRDTPFAWHEASEPHSNGFWLATKHKDVVHFSKDPELYATNAPLLADPLPKNLWSTYPVLAMIADNLMTFDHKKHCVFRPLANQLFSGSRVKEAEAEIRSICTEIIKKACDQLQFDLAHDVALAVSKEIILGSFLGIPRKDLSKVTRWVLTINAMDDPIFRPTKESLLDAAEELFAYGLELVHRVKSLPLNGIFRDLVHNAHIEGVSATQLFLAYWFPLTAGAFDTTASAIAGGALALLQHPEQLKLLCKNPELIPFAIEEIFRWVSPVIYFRRTATSDTYFNGKYIEKGHKIVLCYASANRDEIVFTNPDCFDITRRPNNHVSFGYGPHYCVGARLSSAVLRIFWEEFFRYLPGMQIEGEVLRTRSAWMNRIKRMPVVVGGSAPL